MSKMLFRLLFSFSLILSIGYSQVYLGASWGMEMLAASGSSGEQVGQLDSNGSKSNFTTTVDQDVQKRFLDLDSLLLEKEPEVHVDLHSIDLHLALAAVFFFLLSVSVGYYHTRFLRFYRDFSYTYPHRIHLYNLVFTI
jgi:hypothetical protein